MLGSVLAAFLSLWFALAADEATARRLLEAGRFDAAAAEYQALLAQSPDRVALLTGLAEALIGLKRPAEAVPHLTNAMKIEPENRNLVRLLAQALQEANEFLLAESVLASLLRQDQSDGRGLYLFGKLLYENGYHGGALPAFEKLLVIEPANRKAEVYRAVCLTQLGRLEEAEAAYRKLLSAKSAPPDIDLLLGYTQLLYETGRPEEALRLADQAARAAPENALSYFWKARALMRLNRLSEATQAAEQSVERDSRLPFARSLLVTLYRTSGRLAEAAKHAEWLRE